MSEKTLIGKVSHFYPKISVVVIELEDTLKVGDKISFEKEETMFEQTVESMQIDRENVNEATKGQAIGLRVDQKVSEGSRVFKVVE